MLKAMANVNLTHVPYKGGGPAITAAIGGEIETVVAFPLAALPHIKAGKLRALAVTGAKRNKALPDVPTVAESGVKDYEAVNWYGVFMPAGVSKEIVAKVHNDVVRVLKLPEVKERFAGEGGEIVADTPDEFGAFVRKEIPKWTKVVKDAAVKVD